MIRLVVYLGPLAIAVVLALSNPLVGVILCLESYLINPAVFLDVDVRVQQIATATFLFSCLLNRPVGPSPAGREGGLLTLLWAFVALGALSALWAVVSPRNSIENILEVAKVVLPVSLFVRAIRTEREMSLVILCGVIGVIHASLLHTFGIRFGYVPNSFGRDAGVLPDAHGAVLVLFLPTIALLAMKGGTIERLVCLGGLPFVLNSIISTYQRTYFLALVVQSALSMLLLPRRTVLRLLPVLAFGGILFVFALTPKDYWDRMSTIKRPTEESSANSRFIINEASRRIFLDYPMGVGYRNYPDVSARYLPQELLTGGRRSAHNTYYTIACETGVLGSAIWVSAFGGSVYFLRRIRKQGHASDLPRVGLLAMGLELGFYGWFVSGMTADLHEVDPAFWFVGFTVVLTRLHHQGRAGGSRPTPPPPRRPRRVGEGHPGPARPATLG